MSNEQIAIEVAANLAALDEWISCNMGEPRQAGDIDLQQAMKHWNCAENTARSRLTRSVTDKVFVTLCVWDAAQKKIIRIWRKI